ncbi:zinc finger CCCH domain-containing protein 17-like [Telopea speciosissima]|uniref:zinc finger CCCH domain-containing protein 17-like n=1 Tax=Telopea speciosissima TaxID=54955 RepID=UPI001CC52938|nr:zinc finger CCCH domain-containing protein 17-like [Telopea speciosissima]
MLKTNLWSKLLYFQVWDLETLHCIQTLTDHTSVVMSVLCWDQFLLSCSLDKTIKAWAATESGNLEVTYTHNEEHGVLTLCGVHDAQAKPVLMCSCNDNTIHFYDLPSFSGRGRMFSREEVRAIQIGPGGLFFTGDGTGELKVWNNGPPSHQTNHSNHLIGINGSIVILSCQWTVSVEF